MVCLSFREDTTNNNIFNNMFFNLQYIFINSIVIEISISKREKAS